MKMDVIMETNEYMLDALKEKNLVTNDDDYTNSQENGFRK